MSNSTNTITQLKNKLEIFKSKYINEAETDPNKDKNPEEPIESPEVPEEPIESPEPEMSQDLGMSQDPGMDSMGGFGQEEEPLSKQDLGRTYELKKIYTRLTAIESYLSNESDPELLEIQKTVHQAIKLFEVISSNFDSYMEKIDGIIIMYYKFIDEVYKKVKQHYIKKNREK